MAFFLLRNLSLVQVWLVLGAPLFSPEQLAKFVFPLAGQSISGIEKRPLVTCAVAILFPEVGHYAVALFRFLGSLFLEQPIVKVISSWLVFLFIRVEKLESSEKFLNFLKLLLDWILSTFRFEGSSGTSTNLIPTLDSLLIFDFLEVLNFCELGRGQLIVIKIFFLVSLIIERDFITTGLLLEVAHLLFGLIRFSEVCFHVFFSQIYENGMFSIVLFLVVRSFLEGLFLVIFLIFSIIQVSLISEY